MWDDVARWDVWNLDLEYSRGVFGLQWTAVLRQ